MSGKYLDLDGSTEYASKSSPANLDLNGPELIAASTNRDFETSIGDWVGSGNHAVEQSNGDKKAGTYSMKITASGAGDSTTNYASLPASKFTTIEAGKKYTVEFWCRAVNSATTKLTGAIGGQSKLSGNIAQTAGLATKYVFNFLATANEVDQPLKIYANQADVVYADQVSVTQAWDMLISLWCNQTIPSPDYLIRRGGANASNNGYLIYIYDNILRLPFSDGTTIVEKSMGPTTLSQNTWALANFRVDRINGISTGLNGSLNTPTSIANIGRVINAFNFMVGTFSGSAGDNWNGQIGETQITRFADIANSNVSAATLLAAYQNGIPSSWTNGTVVAHYKFDGDNMTEVLKDHSASGNDLTGTNLTFAEDVGTTADYPEHYTESLASTVKTSSSTAGVLRSLASLQAAIKTNTSTAAYLRSLESLSAIVKTTSKTEGNLRSLASLQSEIKTAARIKGAIRRRTEFDLLIAKIKEVV